MKLGERQIYCLKVLRDVGRCGWLYSTPFETILDSLVKRGLVDATIGESYPFRITYCINSAGRAWLGELGESKPKEE